VTRAPAVAAGQHRRVTDPSLDDAWARLAPAFRRSLELAHTTLRAGGLAVGSVVTDPAGVIVAEGRNRAYDPPTGTDPLEGTPLAHAELNAIARLPTDAATDGLTIWSTQRPCPMCSAAIAFVGLADVRVVATDPSDPAHRIEEELDDEWVVVATAMFMIAPLRRGGPRHAMVAANRELEPEAVAIAQQAVDGHDHPLTAGDSLAAALAAIWVDVQASASARRRRRADGQAGTETTPASHS
jgi:tRNA(Arg) A34 adenosine deaminase TadA